MLTKGAVLAQDRKRAQIYRATRFIYVAAMSGRYGSRPDRQAFEQYLALNAGADLLGAAVRSALAASREFEDDAELTAFFDTDTMLADTQAWNERTLERYGYEAVKTMYVSMQSVSVTQTAAVIVFDPSRQYSGGWTRKGFAPADSCTAPAEASDQEIGRAAINALERCR